MRLLSAHIRNFKLLEEVDLEFSSDPLRPLTVIRAENGSGKTSLLYALVWALYGVDGLPKQARELRLTSTACPTGTPVEVQIRVEFEHYDEASESRVRYRLIRSVSETPLAEDKHDRGQEQFKLFRVTSRGDEEVQTGSQALVSRLVPERLAQVFFTNGDDVQQFISGRVASSQRQGAVHEAIRLLLGLEALEEARGDLANASKKFQKEVAEAGGGSLSEIEGRLEEARAKLETIEGELETATERRSRIYEALRKDERELSEIRGIGDLDEINERIERLKGDLANLEGAETGVLIDMRDLLASEKLSWSLMGDALGAGLGELETLADRNVIPGMSVEVLKDRLSLRRCICGESLNEGSEHRSHVQALIAEQERMAPRRARQTETWHHARRSAAIQRDAAESESDFESLRLARLKSYRDTRTQIRGKSADLESEKARRRLIDEDTVRQLTERIDRNQGKHNDAQIQIGGLEGKRDAAQVSVNNWDSEYRTAEGQARVGRELRAKKDVTDDLVDLADGILKVMKTKWVSMVAERMNTLYLDIVGSDPELDVSVFKRVYIADDFDIVIEAGDGRTLDPDFELNGASQRALTLAFIWSLMEVSGREAPRIIDTPLGMTSGGVKRRIVDMISAPRGAEGADFQVILFMTRSEIRDLEDLLDERAGVTVTLSCSKDYPKDLVNDWGVSRPLVRRCDCSHRYVCEVCQRRYDSQHSLKLRAT